MGLKGVILIVCGFVALILGGVGVFLPIMPTTPFILVSAACFSGSSPRIYQRLLRTRYFGEFIANYRNKTGVEKTVKVKAIAFLWITLIISALIFKTPLVLAILAIVGIAVTVHIALIKTR